MTADTYALTLRRTTNSPALSLQLTSQPERKVAIHRLPDIEVHIKHPIRINEECTTLIALRKSLHHLDNIFINRHDATLRHYTYDKIPFRVTVYGGIEVRTSLKKWNP